MEAKSSAHATPWSPFIGYCTKFKKISEYETVLMVTQESIYIPRIKPGILFCNFLPVFGGKLTVLLI